MGMKLTKTSLRKRSMRTMMKSVVKMMMKKDGAGCHASDDNDDA